MQNPVSLKKGTSVALAALMLAVVLPVWSLPVAAATQVTRHLVIDTTLADPQVDFAGFDGNPPKVFDINGDGKQEIIAQNDNNWFYVFDSTTGKILFEWKTTFPSSWGARTFNGPEIAILKEGGAPRIVVLNSAAFLTVLEYDHAGSTNSAFKFNKLWEVRLKVCYSNPGADSKPVLADLDRDGDLDIVASTEESGVYAYTMEGTQLWAKCIGGGNAEPTVADITNDGFPEVIFGSDGGVVTAMTGKKGTTLWSFDARVRYGLGSGSMPVGAAVGQLDGVGGPEIVVGARDSHDATNFDNNHALLLALKNNGAVLWAKQDLNANPLTYTHPVIVDADRDGQAEVYWGDWNTMGHKPPWEPELAWQTTGPANYYRFAADGTLVWRKEMGTWWSNKDLTIGDIDGDGDQDLLVNAPSGSQDGLWLLDTKTGALGDFISVSPYQVSRAPILADLWATGTMQIVVQASKTVNVLDTHKPYSSVYPHLPYPVLQPPIIEDLTSQWAATFRIASPNTWWQELYITPDTARTVTSAQVRINAEGWQPMAKSSWGAWTSSVNAPNRSSVEFKATDSAGLVSISQPFTWLDGTLTKRSTGSTPPTTTTPPPTTTTVPPTTSSPPPSTTSQPPPTTTPPGNFDASFAVSPNVNEWWVEVTVSGNQAISAVDARVNGGTWRVLTLRSWGNWAGSFNVPRGSIVDFRATSSTGAQDLSGQYCWMATTCNTPTTSVPPTTSSPPPSTTSQPPPTTTTPSGSFDASFFPKAVGNEWWVEVDVKATGHTIATVEAQVNGGIWRTLDKTSWGSWAKSFNVPSGSQVVFRATNTAGAQDTSDPVVWTKA